MRPRQTEYRLKRKDDVQAIDVLWSTTDIPKFPTNFPEIVAEREGEIIGFIARRHDEQGILIEPLLCSNVIVCIRLWHALEAVLKAVGVTTYLFRIEPHRIVFEKALWGAEARGMFKDRGYLDGFRWFERVIA